MKILGRITMCADKPLERVHYYSNQLLTADDFACEQSYFLERFRRHNRYLHGWGVVNGLNVVAQNNKTVMVSPGLAVDCCGNEIYLDVAEQAGIPKNSKLFFITIEFAEQPVNRVPSVSSDLDAPDTQASRIRETSHIAISATDPCANHTEISPGSAGCG